MKKIQGTKLALNRETLVSLQRDALDHVAGGNAAGATGAVSGAVTPIIRPTNLCTAGCVPRTLLGCTIA